MEPGGAFSVKLVEDHRYEETDDEDSLAVHGGRGGTGGAADPVLFAMLTDLRREVAKKHGLPPFVIFSEPSVEDMTVHYPVSLEEMQNITGVGAGKAKRYGEPFVELIARYVEENGIERPQEMVVKSVVNRSGNKVFIIQGIDRKMDFEDIADAKGLSREELMDEVEAIVGSGTRLNIDYYIAEMVDEDKVADIIGYFSERAETDSVSDAARELGPDYTEEEIRLVRVKFLSEAGN